VLLIIIIQHRYNENIDQAKNIYSIRYIELISRINICWRYIDRPITRPYTWIELYKWLVGLMINRSAFLWKLPKPEYTETVWFSSGYSSNVDIDFYRRFPSVIELSADDILPVGSYSPLYCRRGRHVFYLAALKHDILNRSVPSWKSLLITHSRKANFLRQAVSSEMLRWVAETNVCLRDMPVAVRDIPTEQWHVIGRIKLSVVRCYK